MINEIIIHIIFQLILSAIVFWMFVSKELSHNVNMIIRAETKQYREELKSHPLYPAYEEYARNIIPKEDGEALRNNYNIFRYHMLIVLILLPICFSILLYRKGEYLTETLILGLVYIIVIPVNIIFTLVVAPRTYFNSNKVINTTIQKYIDKKCALQ